MRIGAALGGISEEMGDVSLAVQRAENKTDQMRAKAGAIDELVATGVLDDFGGPQDDIERELAQLSTSASVEAELAALKGTGRRRQPARRSRLPRPAVGQLPGGRRTGSPAVSAFLRIYLAAYREGWQ